MFILYIFIIYISIALYCIYNRNNYNYKMLITISQLIYQGLITNKVVREFKELGIEARFEKENINTLDSKGEVLLSILSGLAEDESRSISENSTWGIRRRFEHGESNSKP